MNIRLATVLVAAAAFCGAHAAQVHPSVHRALASSDKIDVMVTMRGGARPALERMEEAEFLSRGAMIENIVDNLQSHNEKATQSLVGLLNAQHESTEPSFSSYQSFWITNTVVIKGATADLIEKLKTLPEVEKIREEIVIRLEEPQVEEGANFELIGHQWGIEKIQAPEVWRDGIFGQNVVVAAIDTGVRHTHEALKKNWRGSFGWHDPEKNATLPYDNNGHGSHVMGTIAGGKGVGVAPGATWMMCKGCRDRGCPGSDLLACAEWVTCPVDAVTQVRDCSKAPHIVSNSWGGGQGEDWYMDAVNAWHKAGIIPVFALGNEGPECGTASSPGDYPNVIGVGSTNSWDRISGFSSKGPAVTGLMKPDISAPGSAVYSAWFDGDNNYKTISGTSMATPHVSGAIALLLSANPDLKYEEIKNRLTRTTDQNVLMPTGYSCGNITDSMWPNNQYGHGRMNIFSAYQGVRAPQPPAPTSAPSPAPTTQAPTPAPTTQAPTPAPTTQAPTPAPTPAPTGKHDKICAPFQKKWTCEFWAWCKWDGAKCKGKW